MEPSLKRPKVVEVAHKDDIHQLREHVEDAELERLYDRLSPDALRTAFVRVVKDNPTLMSYWYKVADTEENMECVLRKGIEALNGEIRDCMIVERDELNVSQNVDESKFKEMEDKARDELRSRNTNAELDRHLQHFATCFASYFGTCASFLDKGNVKLAQFCAQLVLDLYTHSPATKAKMLNSEEELSIVESLISFHTSFLLGIFTTVPMIKAFDSHLQNFLPKLAHEASRTRLQAHLDKSKP